MNKKILVLTTLLALLYYSWGVNQWQFSFVGDDWPFYRFARNIVIHHFFFNPFDFDGVFLQNSVLSSMYQALFLQLFGFTNFAWRLSNIILIVPITIFLYLWVKKLFGATTALYSTLFLQCSFYLANFFKIGKNMPQALALFVVCLFLATKISKNPSKKNFFLLGIMLGISFYIYIGPLFPLMIWPLLLPLLEPTKKKQLLKKSVFLIFGYLLLLLPLLFQVHTLAGPVGKTLFHHEFISLWQILVNIIHNFLLFYHNFDYLYNHFVAGPYLDPITATFALLGTTVAIMKRKNKPFFLVLLVYVCTCVVIGVTSPYRYAPTTRGIFFLPFGAIFAGIALTFLLQQYKNIHALVVASLFFVVFGLNVYQSQIGVFKQTGYSGTSLLVKTMFEAKIQPPQPYLLLISDHNRYIGAQFIPDFQEAYGLQNVQIRPIPSGALTCAMLPQTKILLFHHDLQALSDLKNLNCPQTNYSLKVLNAEIPL